MIPSVAIYVEGGGDTVDTRRQLRTGFDALFRTQKNEAAACGVSLTFTLSGGRQAAYNDFAHASKTGSKNVVALLVDSEDPVKQTGDGSAIAHLVHREGWDLSFANADHVHLMVQCMEAWLVADPDALQRHYGKGFQPGKLSKHQNLELVQKVELYRGLADASKTTSKGAYQKIEHAMKLLPNLDPSQVAKRCPSFGKFINWLGTAISTASNT